MIQNFSPVGNKLVSLSHNGRLQGEQMPQLLSRKGLFLHRNIPILRILKIFLVFCLAPLDAVRERSCMTEKYKGDKILQIIVLKP